MGTVVHSELMAELGGLYHPYPAKTTEVFNRTHHDDRTVRAIVLWVKKQLGVTAPYYIEVNERDGVWGYGGRHRSKDREIIVVLAPANFFPRNHDEGLEGGPPVICIDDWKDALVGIVAHEMTHALQMQEGRDFCEVECEWAEYRMIRLWNEEQ